MKVPRLTEHAKWKVNEEHSGEMERREACDLIFRERWRDSARQMWATTRISETHSMSGTSFCTLIFKLPYVRNQ